MPEVIAQLHSIREQARKNSEDYFINNPIISIGEDTSVDAVLNTKGDPEARKKFCWELMRTLRDELGKTYRSNSGCNFKLEVCIIPWTDGNIYGGYSEQSDATNNSVTIVGGSGGTNIYGGASGYYFANTTNNTVTIKVNSMRQFFNNVMN